MSDETVHFAVGETKKRDHDVEFYTACGLKAVTLRPGGTTEHVEESYEKDDVTCGNCMRTENYKEYPGKDEYMDNALEVVTDG